VAASVAVGAAGGGGGVGGVTVAAFLLQPANDNTLAVTTSKAKAFSFFCVIFILLTLTKYFGSLWVKDMFDNLRRAAK